MASWGVCYQWYRLDEAHRHFRRAIELSALSGFSDAAVYHAVILSRLHQIEDDLDGAAHEIQHAVSSAQVEAPAAVQDEVVAQQIRVHLAQGELAAAEHVYRTATRSGPGQSIARQAVDDATLAYHNRLLRVSHLRILLARGRDRGDTASLRRGVAEASNLIEAAQERHYQPVVLSALLLRAEMHAALSRLDEALGEREDCIHAIVEEGPPIAANIRRLLAEDGLRGVHPHYVERVLDAFGDVDKHRDARTQKATAPLVDPLTDRELAVLRLVVKGMTYNEIADALYISVNTVRTHVKAIYGKLGVNNRTQAIGEATQLDLL